MSIAEVSTHIARMPLHTPFVTALRTATHVESVVVTITDDQGNTGIGESPQVWRVTGESLDGARACVDGPLRDTLLGTDPDDLNTLLDRVETAVVGNRGAKAAIDIALHDLAARRLGISVTRLLGGTRTEAPTDVTLSAAGTDALVAAALDRVGEGFTVLKIKVGADPAGDTERIKAVRAAVGDDIALRLDANQGWNPKQAVSIIGRFEDAGLGIEFVEQPTPAHDLDALAYVTERTLTPVMADESAHTVRDAVEIIRRRAADMINVKLAKCGGLRTGRALFALARAHDMGFIVGSMMESHIGVAAAASLVAACGTTAVSDLDAAWWLTAPPLTYDKGRIVLPSGPGLGVSA